MRVTLTLFLFTCLSSQSSPLERGLNSFGLPFLIFYNPSVICYQKGISLGFQSDIDYNSGNYSLQTALIRKYDVGSFALGYSGETDTGFNQITIGFSDFKDKFSWGGAFDFLLLGGEPQVTIDIAASYSFIEDLYASLIIANIFETDTSFHRLSRKVEIELAGEPINKSRLFFATNIYSKFYDFENPTIGYGIELMLQKDLFKKPILNLYSKGIFEKDKNEMNSITGEFGLGIMAYFGKSLVGLFGGYNYEIESKNNKIFFSFYINPTHAKDETAPEVKIDFSRDFFSPDGDGTHDFLFIGVKCKDNEGGVGLKKWSIFISQNPDDPEKIVKIYSGSSLPPSTIKWEGRDSNDKLLEPGAFYIQMIAIDNNNNISKTKWEKIILRRLF